MRQFFALAVLAVLSMAVVAEAGDKSYWIATNERHESFDRDPGWDGINNHPDSDDARTVVQNFGYSPTTHCVDTPGEIGGTISPAARPASYGLRIASANFSTHLSASGTLKCISGKFHVQLGFFNSKTRNEWRTPNTISIRLLGRGDKFIAFTEYATSKWRAGGDSPGGFDTEPAIDNSAKRRQPRGFPLGQTLPWNLDYNPDGADGAGLITVHLGGQSATCRIAPEHRTDGAVFDRFGLMTVVKSATNGGEVWIGGLTVNGQKPDLKVKEAWDADGNRETYSTTDVRPHGNFGFSQTHFAAGAGAGELGGLIFRGDCRYKYRMAAYGDRLEALDLQTSLHASGKIALCQGVSDSAVLIGFYHSKDSLTVGDDQSSLLPACFLGLVLEGPSREGFLLRPMLCTRKLDATENAIARRPHIYPDGTSHEWDLRYDPNGAGGNGEMTLRMDGKDLNVPLKAGMKSSKTRFDRFGIVTTWVDGNGQRVYLDDLTYTFRAER